MADPETLIGEAVGGLILLISGFIIFRVVQAIAAFVNALEGRPERSSENEPHDQEEDGDEGQ